MDAFKLLKTDHQKVSDLFKRIENGSGQSKAQLFAQLKNELDVHAHIEETILYPALENKEPSREITLEAYEEHQVVKDLLAELEAGSPSEEWDAKLTVLKENVEHHVEEEEGEMFSKARQVLSSDQIDGLGDQMQAEKARQGAPVETSTRGRNNGGNRGRASKSKGSKASKGSESPGMLSRLANLVGLGGGEGGTSGGRKATKSTKKSGKGASKSGASKKAAAKGSSKSSKKAGKKSAGSKTQSSKKSGSKKSGGSKKGRGSSSKKSRR